MTSKTLIVVVMLLSVLLGVDAKRSPRKTEKLYRKAGKWQRKLRDVWALLGVKPFLVQPGEEGDECVLKSKVEEDYVLKGTDVFTQADLDEALQTAALQAETEKQAALAAKDDECAALRFAFCADPNSPPPPACETSNCTRRIRTRVSTRPAPRPPARPRPPCRPRRPRLRMRHARTDGGGFKSSSKLQT